uniref:Uncharacterized protein n=1 Tax=Laticauda laticaudata TaxID=8630 RepID=A0A8C5S657_LATLA
DYLLPWLLLYNSACYIAQEIAGKIQEHNRYQRSGESTTKVSVALGSSLQNLEEKTNRLKDLLFHSVSTRQITQIEGERRQILVDELFTAHRKLQASFQNENTEPDVIRYSIADEQQIQWHSLENISEESHYLYF